MFYVVTCNTFLWYGLESLLYPYRTKLIKHDMPMNILMEKATYQDRFIIDLENSPPYLLDCLKKNKQSPKFIIIKNDDNVPIEYLFSSCYTLRTKESLSQIRDRVLSGIYLSQVEKKEITLSSRESSIVHMSLVGISVKEISSTLGIKSKTVYTHRRQACRKLGVDRVCELLPYKELVKLKILERESQNITEPEPII